MALLEEDERSELPSMSWNSVVRAPAAPPSSPTTPPPPAVAPDESVGRTPAQPSGPSATLSADEAPPVAFSFTTEAIAPTNVAAPSTPAPPTVETTEPPPPPPPPPPTFTLPSIDLGTADEPAVHIEPDEAAPLGMAKPTFALPEVPTAPESTPPPPPPGAQAPHVESSVAPAVVDPTIADPARPEVADGEPRLASSRNEVELNAETRRTAASVDTNEQAVTRTPATVDQAPAIPAVAPAAPNPAPAISLPSRAAVQVAPAPRGRELVPTQRRPRVRKDRSGSVARVGFFLLVVAALVSAGVIFGRPYLFSEAWESNALEFSEPIEAARGADFVEPVLLLPQSTADQRAMVTDHLLGDPAANISMWRALGLAGPDSTDNETLETLISDQAPVLYSPIDGQVYYDQSYVRGDRSALIIQAMAAAALDQDFGFSMGAGARSLDDAALTQAHVNQQAAIIQLNTTNRTPVVDPDMAALAFLPAVLDYQVTAPSVFAELLPPVNDIAPNPLASLAPGAGPGPLQTDPLEQITSTSAVVGDLPIGSAVVTDRAFWYMSFASHLDAATAYEMSKSIDRAGLQMIQNGDQSCAVGTFATLTAGSAGSLKANLDAWAATASSIDVTVSTLPDMTVQIRSCDPGAGFVSFANFGVARQLMAWRAAELAVTNLVTAQGGSGADMAAAFDLISTTPSVVSLTGLPAGTPPSELASAAAVAAIDVVALSSVSGDQPSASGEG